MKHLKAFTDFREIMEPLNDRERGRLFTAILAYAADGKEKENVPGDGHARGREKKAAPPWEGRADRKPGTSSAGGP